MDLGSDAAVAKLLDNTARPVVEGGDGNSWGHDRGGRNHVKEGQA